MSLSVFWTQRALENLATQVAYIARDSPQNAAVVQERLETAAKKLGDFSSGKPGRRNATFEKYVQKT